MTIKRSVLSPNGRWLLVQGNVDIEDNLFVDGNATVDIDLRVKRNATIEQSLFVFQSAIINVDLNVDNNASIGSNANIADTLFSDRLEVESETILNTESTLNDQTNINDNLDVIGNTTITGTTLIDSGNGNITTITGDLLITGLGTQTIGTDVSPIEEIFVDELTVNELSVLNTETRINGNLFVNGAFVQTIGNTANLIEDYFGNNVQTNFLTVNNTAIINNNLSVVGTGYQQFGNNDQRMEIYYGNDMIVANLVVDELANIDDIEANNIVTNTLVVNERTELNTDTFINGNLYVNGVQTQNIGNANNLIEEFFGNNAQIENLTVNQSTSLNTETTVNDDFTVTGGTGTQDIGTDASNRVNTVWSDFANTTELEVEGRTELNGDITVIGDGTQTFGQDDAFNRIDNYYGQDMDLAGDLTLDGDLFMLDENKKDFLDLDVSFVIYVKKNGDDNRSGQNLTNAVKTIRRGLELARKFRAENPVTSLDENTTTVMVSVYPGIYVEEGELEIPENAAVVSAGGQYVTEIHASDDCRKNFRNMFLLNSGSYAQGFTFRNQEVDSFDDPTGGFAYAFSPGAAIKRSPYVRDSSQVSNYNPGSVAAPLDPANANPAVGKGGGMILADRRVLNPNSIFPYILAFGATPRSPNGIGYCARDGAGINGISSLGIFQRICFYALNGGQVTLNNSGTQFGDISMRAKGSTLVVEEKSTTATLVSSTAIADSIVAQANILVDAMWDNLVEENANGNVSGPDGTANTSWDAGFIYDANLCYRDVGYIIDAITYDLVLDTNYNSLIAGQAYRRGASTKVVDDQLQQTVDALIYVRDYIIGDTTTTDDSSPDEDNDTSNVTISALIDPALPESGLGITNYSREQIRAKIETVIDVLRVNKSDQISFTDPSTATQDEIDAKNLLQANREFIRNEVIEFVNVNYPTLEYDETKCSRDVGYIIDALSHDVLYGGNFASRIVADSYFSGTQLQLGSQDESNATIAAYTELQNIVSNVILGTYPGQVSGDIATSTEANTLVSLLDITIDVLEDGNVANIATLDPPTIAAANVAVQNDYNIIVAQKATIQTSAVDFVDQRYATYYEDLAKRDANNLLSAIVFDLQNGTQTVTQSYSLGFYNVNAEKVYPESQEDGFIHTWEFLRDELIDIAGAGTDEALMIQGLIDDVLISTIQNPTIIEFSSLIESLAHQFNNAGAGVNRNALPLNFRQPGFNRPVPFSVLQEDGGRVRWSGADELNNQYFAGGTRINGLTGKFEGRPFNISVRQIARRIANSRGFF